MRHCVFEMDLTRENQSEINRAIQSAHYMEYDLEESLEGKYDMSSILYIKSTKKKLRVILENATIHQLIEDCSYWSMYFIPALIFHALNSKRFKPHRVVYELRSFNGIPMELHFSCREVMKRFRQYAKSGTVPVDVYKNGSLLVKASVSRTGKPLR